MLEKLKARKQPTLALILAKAASDWDIDNAYDAVEGLAERFAEDFCPEVQITEESYRGLITTYKKILMDYVVEANDLLDDWARNAMEEEEVRREGLENA